MSQQHLVLARSCCVALQGGRWGPAVLAPILLRGQAESALPGLLQRGARPESVLSATQPAQPPI